MTIADINTWIVRTWHEYTGLLVLAAGVAGLLVLAGVLIYAKVSNRPIRPAVIWSASNLALLLNAEGMWRIAVTTLHLPKGFAILVFAVFEVALMVAMSLASEQYQRTTKRDARGRIDKPGHPGKMLYVAWMIAILSGLVVASNAATTTEKILRLALPIIVVTMWWATMTAEGQTRRRGRFAYSPTRLMERYGLLTPDEDPDFERMARERRIRAMVTYAHRLETNVWGASWHEWRLTRLARTADEAMATQVAEQLDRTITIVNRVVPSRRPFASDSVLAGGTDAPALASAAPALTAGGVSAERQPSVSGQRQPIRIGASDPRQVSVSGDRQTVPADASPAPRQSRGDRVNGSPVLASAHTGRRASVTAPLALTSATPRQVPGSHARPDAPAPAGAPAHAPARPRAREAAPADEARQRYLDSVSEGHPLTGRQLGAMYDRSESWGRTVIASAKAADASADASTDADADVRSAIGSGDDDQVAA